MMAVFYLIFNSSRGMDSKPVSLQARHHLVLIFIDFKILRTIKKVFHMVLTLFTIVESSVKFDKHKYRLIGLG